MSKPIDPEDKIISLADIPNMKKSLGIENRTVVFTNGCFDILHLGHVDYLSKAAKLGDFLVVGLNSDASVRRIKGPGRPVQDQRSRSHVLASLQFVDLVVIFEEDTPLHLIKSLKPDVLVKGSDYQASDIVGYEVVIGNGGRVETIDFVKGYSTTKIIDRVKKI